MNIAKSFFLILATALISSGCKKSPAQLYKDMTTQRVTSPDIKPTDAEDAPAPAADSLETVPVEPNSAGQNAAESSQTETALVETTTAPEVSETVSETQQSSIDDTVVPEGPENAPYAMCHALLKTMKTEPYFYQFQANLKKFRTTNRHIELIAGHLQHHRIAPSTTPTRLVYEECTDIVLAYERYQEVNALWLHTAWEANEEMNRRLLAFRSKQLYYPMARCAEVIVSLQDDTEFSALITELSRPASATLSPEVMMGSLLAGGDQESVDTKQFISPKGCIKALKSFSSFQEVEIFAASDTQKQLAILGAHSTTVVAH